MKYYFVSYLSIDSKGNDRYGNGYQSATKHFDVKSYEESVKEKYGHKSCCVSNFIEISEGQFNDREKNQRKKFMNATISDEGDIIYIRFSSPEDIEKLKIFGAIELPIEVQTFIFNGEPSGIMISKVADDGIILSAPEGEEID